MTKNIDKFREPKDIIPQFSSAGHNVFGIMLSEISKLKARNKQKQKEADLKGIEFKLEQTPLHYHFTNDDLAVALKCTVNNLYSTMPIAAKKLASSPVRTKIKVNERRVITSFLNLFVSTTYDSQLGFSIKLTDDGRKYIDKEIDENFAEIDFNRYVDIKSKYSKRLLKILHSHKKESKWVISLKLETYKKLLSINQENPDGEIDETFKREDNFRLRAIVEPFAEILAENEDWIATDDKKLGYELRKTKRTYTHIDIKMRYIGSGHNTITASIDSNKIETNDNNTCFLDQSSSTEVPAAPLLGLSDVAEPISLTDKEKLIAKIQLYKMMIKDRPQLMTLDRVLEVFALSEKYNFKLDDDELNTLYKLFAELNA